jgi:hypothetical protein
MSVMFSIEMSCLCHFHVICQRRRTGRSCYQRPKRRAAVALYAIASRDRCRLTGEWLRNAYADFMDNSDYPFPSSTFSIARGADGPIRVRNREAPPFGEWRKLDE